MLRCTSRSRTSYRRKSDNRRLPREEADAVARRGLHAKLASTEKPAGLATSGRPSNFAELHQAIEHGREWELAWSEFLHEFFYYKQAAFFAVHPDRFSPKCQALLAGTAEFLSKEFGLPVPARTEEPQYFLREWWTPWGEWLSQAPERVEARKAKAHPAFLRRKVIFESRNLITL